MRVPLFLMTLALGLRLTTTAVAGDGPSFEASVRAFAKARHGQAREFSTRLELPLPPQAELFFRVAETGPWEAVSNAFEQVKQQTAYGTAIPQLQNELWAPVHETFGIWEVWVGWKRDSALLAMLAEPILASMPKGSIYFGGTDYGRFVITTVNAVQQPPRVFCITQNALADNTYAAYLRAIYGQDLWMPQQMDSARAFQRYVEEVKSGKRAKNSEIEIVNGRVKVSGALGVMEINGIICEVIFDHNKATHEFFVEESYVLSWMYPYLEPHGLIMKLNREPLPELPEESVVRDRRFWADYETRLSEKLGFAGNHEAAKAFSKLRSAIGGLYEFRQRYGEAEAAFRQAVRLCASSVETSSRLADMLVKRGKIAEAIRVMEAYVAVDPLHPNDEAVRYLEELKEKWEDGNR